MESIKLFWGSSYDRGLDTLLFMWPDILERFPDAQLHICYGWDLFDIAQHDNPERMQWKKSVQMMMGQNGIVHHGRVGQDKLGEIRKECDIWAYPTWFPEINCITALECQNDGVIPMVMNHSALRETVGSGVRIDGDTRDPEVQQKYLEELLKLMESENKMAKESKKAKKFAKDFYWKEIAEKWIDEFIEPVSTPLVSVITVTIREGWWNIMAHNLSKQTYKDFEWVIVDDHKDDRSKIAQKYAKKYDLKIRYIRGDKVLGKYKKKHGLARANNTGYRAAKGSLCVFLQDFILIPERGVEALVDIHRHHPDSLIAPVDQYWFPLEPNKGNAEDWWDGETNVIKSFSWRNVRMKFKGIRETENPYDFEMNYSAIPKSTLEYLNGWYEFFDDGMGYDNTEIAHRALKEGFKILIDDTNIAECIDIGHHGLELNKKGWEKFTKGDYPNVRTKEIDK